eukprot:Gb_31833 [translate_table: standard]
MNKPARWQWFIKEAFCDVSGRMNWLNSAVEVGEDQFTLAGYCRVCNDFEPCQWEVLPSSDFEAPKFRVVFSALEQEFMTGGGSAFGHEGSGGGFCSSDNHYTHGSAFGNEGSSGAIGSDENYYDRDRNR